MNLYEYKNLENKHILLKNVDGSSVGILHPTDIKFNPRFGQISTLEFTVYKDTCPYYDLLTSYKRIEIDGLMKFIMGNPQIINNGITEYKIITCKSFEIDINRKSIPLLQGTYKFYSPIITDETICSIILSYLPNWTISNVDSKLWNLYRTFDIQNKPLYDFIINECSQSFECVFDFDTINQTISIIAYENIPKKTDVYFSNNNLVNELQLTEKTDQLFTSLQVFGANELSINLVNPTGSTIYNFSHFLKQDGFMSDTLKTRILEWQNEINTQQPIYADLLTQRATKLSELIALQTELTELTNELKALEITRDALLDSGLSAVGKNAEVKAKRIEINNKEIQIDNKQDEIDSIDIQLQTIQNSLSLSGFFTTEEFLEIEPYVIETSITDDNFVIVETDTELDKQETAQALYDKYKNLLDDVSKLKYEFAVDLLNFLPLEEYQVFTNQMKWGSQVTLKVNDKGDLVYPMLLGLDIDWNDNIDIKYLFSTEVKLSDAMMDYDDFSNEVSNMSNKMAGDSIKWGEYVRSGSKDRLNSIFENGLRADLTQIVNSEKQEMVINQQGLLGRKYISDGVYEDEQIKITNNRIGFTTNNWNSLSTVIGKVTLPDGSVAFGGNAGIWMGELVAGNQLVIKNTNNSFVLDGNGAVLKNATLTIEKGLNKILLDPTNGFKIQKNVNNVFTDMIYLDTNGNAVFKGNIDASTINGSSFTGGSINIGNGKFTVNSNGDLIANSGTFKGTVTSSNISDSDIVGSSINIANNFTVTKSGEVYIARSLNIANKFIVDATGVLSIDAEKIVWTTHDPNIAVAQNTANTALQNTATLTQTVNGITTRVTNTEGYVSSLQQTASSLTSRITYTEEENGIIKQDISTLTQTTNSFSTRISTAEGNISTIRQTSDAIALAVNSSKLTFNSSGLTISNGGFKILDGSSKIFGVSSGGVIELYGGRFVVYNQPSNNYEVFKVNSFGQAIMRELFVNYGSPLVTNNSIFSVVGATNTITLGRSTDYVYILGRRVRWDVNGHLVEY